MARIRTIKPEFWRHEALSELPEATHLLAAALLNYADDEGFFNANPKLVQAECCPLREPSIPIAKSIGQLAAIGYIALGRAEDGRIFGRVVGFEAHQKINKKTPSKISKIAIVWEDYGRTTGGLREDYRPEQGTGNREQGREKEQEAGAPAPALIAEPYAWHGRVVKLTPQAFADWKRAFAALDLEAELIARDAWLATQDAPTQRNWFLSTSKFLANRNMEAKAKGQGPPPRRSELAVALDELVEKARKHDEQLGIGDGTIIDLPANGRGSPGLPRATGFDDSGDRSGEADPFELPAKH
jgi:hypothetical protein